MDLPGRARLSDVKAAVPAEVLANAEGGSTPRAIVQDRCFALRYPSSVNAKGDDKTRKIKAAHGETELVDVVGELARTSAGKTSLKTAKEVNARAAKTGSFPLLMQNGNLCLVRRWPFIGLVGFDGLGRNPRQSHVESRRCPVGSYGSFAPDRFGDLFECALEAGRFKEVSNHQDVGSCLGCFVCGFGRGVSSPND